MKICLHCQSLSVGKGGAERIATELAHEMANRGHSVYLCYKNNGLPAYSISEGIKVKPYDSFNDLKKQIININPDIFFTFYVNHFLVQHYSLIHDQGIPFGMQECTNPERLISNNWGGIDKNNKSIFRSEWEREIIASGAHRIRLTMPIYITSFPFYIQKNVKAFSNPAFPQKRTALSDRGRSDMKVIINIGGVKDNKNLITLLKAFSLLAKEYSNWVIKVFGKSLSGKKPHEVELIEFIKKNHLEKKVIFCGPTDDIFSEFVNSQIHVISSLSEGCPNCVLEAMVTGLPSIGFADCPGTNELIRDGENGLLVSPDDRVNNLGQALRKLMDSADLREKMGAKALEDSKAFAPGAVYDQWEQLFYEASEYKADPERLFREQIAIDPERAIHARRMREKLVKQIKGA